MIRLALALGTACLAIAWALRPPPPLAPIAARSVVTSATTRAPTPARAARAPRPQQSPAAPLRRLRPTEAPAVEPSFAEADPWVEHEARAADARASLLREALAAHPEAQTLLKAAAAARHTR